MHFIELLSLRGIKKTWNFIMNFSCVFLGDTFISQFSYGFHKWTTHPKSRLFSYIYVCISVFTKNEFIELQFFLRWNSIWILMILLRTPKNQEIKWLHCVWKLQKMSHLTFSILVFFTNFCPIKIDLSGNTTWPQASGFQ